MNLKKGFCLFGIACATLLAAAPTFVFAKTHTVVTDTGACPADTVTNPCYTTVQAAIDAALAGDSVEIKPGIYIGHFTLNKNVSLYGNETAATFLSGGGSGAILTVENVATSIRRITFINADTGILIRNSLTVTVEITNNVFLSNTTAVQAINSPTTKIANNTIWNSVAGIISDSTALNIKNNIFSTISIAIKPATLDLASIQNNLFFGCTSVPPVIVDTLDPNYKGNIINEDPLFVAINESDPARNDLHLLPGSPCINSGSTSEGLNKVGDTTRTDMGAFGGPNADAIPRPATDLIITAVTGSSPVTLSLGWSPNPCYLVGGYKVSYGISSGSYTATVDAGDVTTYDVAGLSLATAPTGAPLLTNGISNGTLILSWETTTVSGPTGYEIRYDTAPGVIAPPATPSATTAVIDAGSVTRYSLTGLTNGTTYYIRVTPYAQNTYYLAVQTYYAASPANPGTYSNEVSRALGSRIYGNASNEISDYPEALDPYPDLPNSGRACFIATAAYGDDSAFEVRILRDFRDRCLLTNRPGRAFVRWYYEQSPAAAGFLNDHPGFKPLVRAALIPAVGVSLFMSGASGSLTSIMLLLVVSGIALIRHHSRRKRSSGPGGIH